jgi:hydrogenase maturation protein HypF
MDKRKSYLITKRILVYGMVQGVGFRPLVYHIAEKHGINGTVRNLGGTVEIIAQAAKESSVQDFLTELIGTREGAHEIVHVEIEEILPMQKEASETCYENFSILDSGENDKIRILPPDLPVCSACEKELFDPTNRRYGHPLISCTACGPRYTIIEDLPYDRDTTSMDDFEMCDSCKEEYISSGSRRHHAQTISCHDCGPFLIYQDREQIKDSINNKVNDKSKDNGWDIEKKNTEENHNFVLREEAFLRAVQVLQDGGIIAVKGIGGYHFVCSPFHEDTVSNLRLLKGREEKPFAVMFHELEQLSDYCDISQEEEKLLSSSARPIVLLYATKEMASSVTKGSIYLGAFLPYTPLQLLLTKECGPLIMTSANLSGQPIIREDEKILQLSSPYLQGVLYHTRRIVRSVDDTVAKIIDHTPQLIRRSRGYVPYPVFIGGGTSEEKMIFAAGGDLKAAFCLYREGAAFLSQYFGDLEEITIIEEYEQSIEDLKRLLQIIPAIAVCDLHPNYYSTRYTLALGLPVLQVQHHHAHIASVMAENHLTGEIIGVAFDGTGYGTDGNIWGGEFFVCEGNDYKRVAHLNYIPILGGDESMKDARKTATCYLTHLGLEEHIHDDRRGVIQAALKQNMNCIQTSSMGRLFDVVASLLDIAHYNHYEGECATLLEKMAVLAMKHQIPATKLNIEITQKDGIIDINVKPMLEQLCRLRDHEDARALALGFHYSVSEMIVTVCEIIEDSYQLSKVVLSGGVFVNTVLTEKAIKDLRDRGFTSYRNTRVPVGDGGISLGQIYLGQKWISEDQ